MTTVSIGQSVTTVNVGGQQLVVRVGENTTQAAASAAAAAASEASAATDAAAASNSAAASAALGNSVLDAVARVTLPTLWMDLVNGDDGNSGTLRSEPIKTFAALEAHAGWVDGAVVAIKRPAVETVIRDGIYAASADNRTIVSYGEGLPLPILDGTDVALNASFTVNGTYATCYDISWSHDLQAGATTRFRVFEDGKPLKRVSTLAAADATAGTYYYSGTPSTGVAKTITIHPYGSTNAVSDGKTYEITAREAAIHLGDSCRIDGFHGRKTGNNDGAFRLGYDGRADVILSEEGTKHNWVFGDGVFNDIIAINCIDDEYNPDGAILGTNFVTDATDRSVLLKRCAFIVDPSVYGDTIATGEEASSAHYAHYTGTGPFANITFTDCWMSKTGAITSVAESITLTDFFYAAAPNSANPTVIEAAFPVTIEGGVFFNASRIVNGPKPTVTGILAINETTNYSGGLFPLYSAAVLTASFTDNIAILGSGLNENQSVIYYGSDPGGTLTLTANIFDGPRQTMTVEDADITITADDNVYRSHTGNAMIFNVDGVQKSFAQWQAFGYDAGGIEGNPQWAVAKPTIASPDISLTAAGNGDSRLGPNRITQAEIDLITARPVTLAEIKTYLNAMLAAPLVTGTASAGGGSGTVTNVGGTGTINGLTLTGTVTTTGNLTLGGALAVNNADWSGTDLAVANGGTGASDASGARTNLGLVIGTNVQAYSANLDEYAAVNPTAAGLTLLDDADAAAQRTTLGLGTAAVLDAVDEDDMASNSATKVPTQQSVKTYVDTEVASIGGSPPDMIALAADYTLTSTTSSQKLFDTTTNGRLDLATGLYKFTCMVAIGTMSATSGNANFSILGAGSATLAGQHIDARGLDNSSAINGAAVARGGATALGASTFSGNTATAGSGTALAIVYDGYFRVTSAGTIVPSIALTTAAAAVVKAGTIFTCERIAGHADYSQGSWD